MVEAGMGGSHMMNMMMLSQGLGGTGTNQLALYNVLNRRNKPRYVLEDETIYDPTATYSDPEEGYDEIKMGREGDDIMAMMYGGLGGLGASAGSMYPTLMYGGVDGSELMNAHMSVSGAW
jgi:hypothetical protein